MSIPIKAHGIEVNTVSLTDYKLLSPKLAKVIIAYTGRQDRNTIAASLNKQMNHMAAVVENSFRQVKAGVAIGFVRTNKEVRVPANDNEIRASYKVMSSNILMDNKDKSLWEVREGAGGKYLARHGQEDLSELIESAVNRRTDVPNLRQIAMASAAKGEYVAFVSPSGDMDYGFATGVRSDAVRVVSTTTQLQTVVPKSHITASFNVPIPKKLHQHALQAASKGEQKDYWSKLYGYDPAYMKEVQDQVDEGTVT